MIRYPYLVTSDQHCHNWSQFAVLREDGINSRLENILNEMSVAHAALHDAGGDSSFYGGDLFHVRGKIEPSVFNPTFARIKAIHDRYCDLTTYAIPGNHDLEGRNADELGNAMQQLSSIEGFHVYTQPTLVAGTVLVVPWYQDLDDLRAILKEWSEKVADPSQVDVIIHAPVNAVIKGIPDHGLEASELAAYGFRRVLSGHYHDHKVMEGGKVISIGATTHQTWNDPGTKAGFLLVYEDRVEFHETTAPKFVDIGTEDYPELEDLRRTVEGNYVRFKIEDATDAEIKQWRDELEGLGAIGVNMIATKKRAEATRAGTSVSASKTLEASVAEYIASKTPADRVSNVQKLCADFIARARMEA